MISRHHNFLEEISNLLTRLRWNAWKFRIHRANEIDEFAVATLYIFSDFGNVVRHVLLLDDRVQHLDQTHELFLRTVGYLHMLWIRNGLVCRWNRLCHCPSTFSTSMHSNSNLSATWWWWWWPRFDGVFSASLDGVCVDDFLKTSNRFRFFGCLRSPRLACFESCDIDVDANSALWRTEFVAPCNIDLTACTSRFSGDSFGFFTSAATRFGRNV